MQGSSYLRSIVFLNCGGRLDLTDQWFAAKDDVKCYVIDSHRPINHRNINEQAKIFVIHDGCKSFSECPNIEDARLYEELVENASDVSDEYDSEQSEHSDLEEAKQELEDLKEGDDDEEEVLDDGLSRRKPEEQAEEGDGVEPEGSQGSQKVGEKRPAAEDLVDTRKLKRQKRQIFMNYYGQGTYYGKSTAGMMYELCSQLNKTNKDLLWYRIVGLADLIVHCKAPDVEYQYEIDACNDEVQRLQPNEADEEMLQDVVEPGEKTAEAANENYKSADLFKLVSLKTSNKELGYIIPEAELKMFMLRHWTLYDSICNSNYLVSRLKIGKEPGNKLLKRFLVEIGCPIDQAKQKYEFMNPKIKEELKRKILTKSSEFGLEKVLMRSFVRQVTETVQVSATDMAYALSTLLEYPSNVNTFTDEQSFKQGANIARSHMAQSQKNEKENFNSRNLEHKLMAEKMQ